MAKLTDGTENLGVPMLDLWDKFLACQAESLELPELLKLGKDRWALGTVADVLSRWLREEEVIQRKRPDRRLSFPLVEMNTLRMTQRIDGILPIPIPVPFDLRHLGDELIKECLRLGMEQPDSDQWDRVRDEIAICYLAFLHRRKIKLNYQLEMELVATCPGGNSGGPAANPAAVSVTADQLMLQGILPLGGRVVFCYSSLDVQKWSELGAGGIEHHDVLQAGRGSNGQLKIVDGSR